MLKAIPEYRTELSPYAPKMLSTVINPEKIGDVVGKQGKVINKIIEQTGTKIDIEEDGTVCIACYGDIANAKRAQAIVESIAHDPEVGDMFVGVVVRILSTMGAFVEIAPGKDGMIHISKLSRDFVSDIHSVIKKGDSVTATVRAPDYSEFTRTFNIGAGSFAEGYPQAVHHPEALFNDGILSTGAAAYAYMALRWLG